MTILLHSALLSERRRLRINRQINLFSTGDKYNYGEGNGSISNRFSNNNQNCVNNNINKNYRNEENDGKTIDERLVLTQSISSMKVEGYENYLFLFSILSSQRFLSEYRFGILFHLYGKSLTN